MTGRLLAALCTLGVSGAATGSAQDGTDTLARLDQKFSEAAAHGGSYILRYEANGRATTRTYGHLDCGRTRAMVGEAVVDAGSITKDFTRAAIYKLVEQGRLAVDAPLSSFFANLPVEKRAITISQLLDMSSGLPDLVLKGGRVVQVSEITLESFDYAPLSRGELVEILRRAPLVSAPGTKTEYSNLGYQLLAAVIESASGSTYEQFVRRAVLLPAGMTATGYLLPDYAGATFADQCRAGASWGDPVSKRLWRSGVSWYLMGAGGMMTTVEDLARFQRAIDRGALFRPDIQKRFVRSTTRYSRRCRTELRAFAGSNALTTTTYVDLPEREESLVAVSTRSDSDVLTLAPLNVLCPT